MVGCEVTWGELLWHVTSCHLMWWSWHLMRCDCSCCAMSRDAMSCDVRSCYELSSVVHCSTE